MYFSTFPFHSSISSVRSFPLTKKTVSPETGVVYSKRSCRFFGKSTKISKLNIKWL